MSKPNYKSLQRTITRDDKHSIESRWEYGRAILADPKKMANTGDQLRAGAIEALIADAKAVGSKLSEREIRYRVQCARTYKTVDEIRHVCAEYEDWSELRTAGFPEVTVDEDPIEPDDLEAVAPDAWEQLTLLPGFKPIFKVHGRELKIDDATVPDLIAYRDMYRQKHEGYAKTLELIEATVEAIFDGWDGDPEAKAVDAYRRGAGAA